MWVKAASILLLVTFIIGGMGCYNPNHFRSDDADLLDLGYFSSPQYMVLFHEFTFTEGRSASYEFATAPSLRMVVGVDFLDAADLEMLMEHQAEVAVTIIDVATDETVYQRRGSFRPERPARSGTQYWGWGGFPSTLPPPEPPEWKVNNDGRVVRQEKEFRPRSNRAYRMTVEVFINEQLPEPVTIRPLLAGGWRAAL